MTKDELSKLLLPNHSNCMICLEDAESAFQSAAELEKQQNRMKYVSFGKGGFGNQVGASDGGNVGGGNGGSETPNSADGAPPSSFGGPGPEVVTPDVFIKLLRGEGATSPNKRLIFFSTVRISILALDPIRLGPLTLVSHVLHGSFCRITSTKCRLRSSSSSHLKDRVRVSRTAIKR